MALFIGAYLPDQQLDQSAFCNALTSIAIALAQYRQHPLQQSTPRLDLYFLMPGWDEMPPFEGLRLHFYDDFSKTLKIESSVPENIVHSAHAEKYVVAAVLDAIDQGYDFFSMKQMVFERDGYMDLIETLSACNGAYLH